MQPVDPPAVDQIVGLAGGFPSPDPVDTDAERSCERYGYLCSAADADDAQYAAAYEALRVVDAAMTTSTDAHEQLVLGLRALAGIADVGHVEVDLERLLALSLGPADASIQAGRHQAETLRRMTMAMARDVRVVMVRLASCLQNLRRAVADGLAGKPASFPAAHEALTVLAPLANRLGLFRLKWEMEDLAFRCTQPEVYRDLARRVEATRTAHLSSGASASASIRVASATKVVMPMPVSGIKSPRPVLCHST